LPTPAAKFLAEIEADPSRLEPSWDRIQFFRRRQRRLCREPDCDGFLAYAEAVKCRLARHEFTLPFELNEDPKKQDRLVTWIEYLNYEYWWLDKYTGSIERLKPDNDRAWQELVDEKVLRPHETQEFVRTMASPMERQVEEDGAMKVVRQLEAEAKRIYTLTQESPQRLSIPRAKRMSMMEAGATKLNAAKRRLHQIRSRNRRVTDFIRATFDYADAKRDAARQQVRVHWVLEQIPLVEAEMAHDTVTMTEPSRTTRPKRSLTTDEETPGERRAKRPKLDRQTSRPSISSRGPTVPPKAKVERFTVTEKHVSQGNDAHGDVAMNGDAEVIIRGPRRSARIAARASQQAPKVVSSQTRQRPRPRTNSAAKPSETGGAAAQRRSGRRLGDVGRRGVAKHAGTSQIRPQRRHD